MIAWSELGSVCFLGHKAFHMSFTSLPYVPKPLLINTEILLDFYWFSTGFDSN